MVSFVNISACDSQEKEKGEPESHHYTLKSNTHLFKQIYNQYSSGRLLIFLCEHDILLYGDHCHHFSKCFPRDSTGVQVLLR